jgi:ubiquinone/menaquinone biosynthesis C-methylase UbiE
MMKFAVLSLKSHNNFQPVPACAEQTGLANESIDLICIGQAFHWFEKEKDKREFRRILKKTGYLAILGKKTQWEE